MTDVRKRHKVLVVDDVEYVQLMYKQAFADLGYDLRFAKYGDEALQLYQTFHPELIILDIKLPDMSGLQVLQRIRANDKETMVIMSTAFNMADMVRQAAALGVSHYIAKPVDIDGMLARVKKLLGEGGDERETAAVGVDNRPMLRRRLATLKQDAIAAMKHFIQENEDELLKLQAKELLDDIAAFEEQAGNVLEPPLVVEMREKLSLRRGRLKRTLRNLEGKGKDERVLATLRTMVKSMDNFLDLAAAFEAAPPA
ncbi:MAG TPA: response regulator [bacterium]|nr:response regulator [bacterium]